MQYEKFKDGLWEVDGIAGQRFRDPRDPNQMSFDILKPDFTPLERAFVELAEQRGEVSLEALPTTRLRETIYKGTHAKPTVDRLVEQQRLEAARTGKSYAERIYRPATPRLFSDPSRGGIARSASMSHVSFRLFPARPVSNRALFADGKAGSAPGSPVSHGAGMELFDALTTDHDPDARVPERWRSSSALAEYSFRRGDRAGDRPVR